ncbi:hypothetical protein [Fibrobacter sp.]|uniref:hypothetical protein n=1 Tax=Fibrobacter sp. TaxID=35828 RepID=UPI00389004AC
MGLSVDLLSQFAKITKQEKPKNKETTVYGTIVEYNGGKYVKLDGSDLLTPISSTTNVKGDERVTVTIKNHSAIVTGNLSSPSARTEEVEKVGKDVADVGAKIDEFDVIIADKVNTSELNAEIARIDTLVSENVKIRGDLEAQSADIKELEADNVTIKDALSAAEADIGDLQAENVEIDGKLKAKDAEIESLQTDNLLVKEGLVAVEADIGKLDASVAEIERVTTEKLEADAAAIKRLETEKLSTESADIKYANIDFSNIGKAAMEYLYAQSGLIKDVVVDNGTITGHLIGVTISGDRIEGNTIIAEKLVIKGDDGLYYKLNTDGVSTEAEQTDYNSLDGSIIKAKSITATKIKVTDLVAFGATIGGFKIAEGAIFSGVKESVDNTTAGIYMDSAGQICFGDANNFVKFYKDKDGLYKLAISAEQITFGGSRKNVETAIQEVKNDVDTLRDEITTLLRIESSRGTVFKNDTISTVLSAVIYHGTQRITDSATMKSVFGNSAYLQWKWQRLDEDTYGVISASDKRFGDNGFTFTLSPDDVDTKVTFMCELIV